MISRCLIYLLFLLSTLTSCLPSTADPAPSSQAVVIEDSGNWTLSFTGDLTSSYAKDPNFPESGIVQTGVALKGIDRQGQSFTSFQMSQRNNENDFFFRLQATERQEDGSPIQTMQLTIGNTIYQGRAILSYDESNDGQRVSGSIIGINLSNASGDIISITGFVDLPIKGQGGS